MSSGRSGLVQPLSIGRHWPVAVAALFHLLYLGIGFSLLRRGVFECPNLLFNADAPRVLDDLTKWSGNHHRSGVHPLFPLLALPFGTVLSRLFEREFVALVMVAVAGALAVFFVAGVLRTITSEGEAISLSIAYGASASSLMLFSTRETFAFSALGISATLYCVRTQVRPRWHALAVLGLFGTSTTNLAHVFGAEWLRPGADARQRARCGFRWVVFALGMAFPLSVLQRALLPSARLFFSPWVWLGEGQYTPSLRQWGDASQRAAELTAHFFAYALVAPQPRFWMQGSGIEWVSFLASEGGHLARYSAVTTPLAIVMTALLLWSTYVHVSAGRKRPETWAAAFVLAGHWLLFFFYGDDLMLYSPLWTIHLLLWVGLALSYADHAKLKRPPWPALTALGLGMLACNLAFALTVVHRYDGGLPCASMRQRFSSAAESATSSTRSTLPGTDVNDCSSPSRGRRDPLKTPPSATYRSPQSTEKFANAKSTSAAACVTSSLLPPISTSAIVDGVTYTAT